MQNVRPQILTPREVAEAIGVSESSIKRWVDDGVIRATRTAGGHRRISVGEAVRFVRETQAILVRPELLGLAEVADAKAESSAAVSDAEQLFAFLKAGAAVEVRGLLMSLYLGGRSVAQMVDGPIREAMSRIGELWIHEKPGIFWEHRATDIMIEALAHLRSFLAPRNGEPRAVGGAPSGDPYILPSLGAATVLEAAGVGAVNLGPDTPFSALRAAVEHLQPRIVWLSVSSDRVADSLGEEVRRLMADLRPEGVPLVLGGSKSPQLGLPPDRYLHVGDSMAELEALAKGLRLAPDEAAV